ncbi:MAG: hypothetical protein SWH61_02470 [Thermodesulfobacteriota bacterium]|nr:hypothetical protein [Thermodesulfobacteriota bacterium]
MSQKAETNPLTVLLLVVCGMLLSGGGPGCSQSDNGTTSLSVPRGYAATLEIDLQGRRVGFGPFVGYYFKPKEPGDLTRLEFVCFNEQSFYTRDLEENAMLFAGEAVFTRLPEADMTLPAENRINPVFFSDAPEEWLQSRPSPQDTFLHFHSCYDAAGPVRSGFWIRHVGKAAFTYDMGGRVGPESPLYHQVRPGVDKAFARIMEFDRGPEQPM